MKNPAFDDWSAEEQKPPACFDEEEPVEKQENQQTASYEYLDNASDDSHFYSDEKL